MDETKRPRKLWTCLSAQQPTPGFQSAVSGRTTMENLSINVHTYPSVDQATWELSTIDNLNSRDIVKQETINNALHVAVNKGQIEMVMLLLEAGTNVNKADVIGSTPNSLAKQQKKQKHL